MPPPSHRDVSHWSPLVIQYPRAGQYLCAMAHSVWKKHPQVNTHLPPPRHSINHPPPTHAISECTFILNIIGTRITETVSLFIIMKLLFILILRNLIILHYERSQKSTVVSLISYGRRLSFKLSGFLTVPILDGSWEPKKKALSPAGHLYKQLARYLILLHPFKLPSFCEAYSTQIV